MQTLADLSDTPQFTIKAACAHTGIQSVTLRAWERRYQLLAPQRTTGNYRLYSERDLALLRWVKRRLEEGQMISKIAEEFHAMRQAGAWPEVPPAPPSAPSVPSTGSTRPYAERLYQALVRSDEPQAMALLQEARKIFDVPDICLGIIQPALAEIGEAWHRGLIRIATEHFASQFIRGQLLTLFQAYPMRHSAPRIVVGCAPHEFHDIGSLMLALFLRREGYRVEFLGPDVHVDDLGEYARAERPALICLSANSDDSVRELRQVETRLAGMRPRPKFGFGGRIFNVQPDLRATVPGLFLGENGQQALDNIRNLLPL